MDRSMHTRLAQALNGTSRRVALRIILGGTTIGAAEALASPFGSNAKHHKHHKHHKHKCKQKKCKGLALGEFCETAKDCCSNETNLLCSIPNGGSQTACCAFQNGACAGDSDCCVGFICLSPGVCVVGNRI
jgi:hypothetical protein